MKLGHVAVWTRQLETLKDFYVTYFGATHEAKYVNPRTLFESYFLKFPDGDATLELMTMPSVQARPDGGATKLAGLTHLAFDVATPDEVDEMARRLQQAGIEFESMARKTGDGYYECAVRDPDHNIVEITCVLKSA